MEVSVFSLEHCVWQIGDTHSCRLLSLPLYNGRRPGYAFGFSPSPPLPPLKLSLLLALEWSIIPYLSFCFGGFQEHLILRNCQLVTEETGTEQ